MDLIIAFGVFLTALGVSLFAGISTLYAMGAGLLCFALVGLRRGFHVRDLVRMAMRGGRKSLGILRVFFLIGLITSLWRSGGVIAYFVHYGLRVITPPTFLILAFGLCCVLAYALGTSFGIVGTVGVVLMTIARSGGVNPALAAGVILSAAYFGDRSSPASSSLNLITLLTKTRLTDNVRGLWRTGILPLCLTAAAYLLLSLSHPLAAVDRALVDEISAAFTFTPWLLLPAGLMLFLPLLKVDVLYAMCASAAASFVLTIAVQGMSLADTLKACLFGFSPQGEVLAAVFSGGGLLSMVSVSGIVLLSSCYSGIFESTRMLEHVQHRMIDLSRKIGRFPANAVLGVAFSCIFCSQTLATLMSHQLLESSYEKDGGCEHLLDISNSTGVLSSLVPWCLSCAVPLQMMRVGPEALPWAFYLFLIPLCYGVRKGFKKNKD